MEAETGALLAREGTGPHFRSNIEINARVSWRITGGRAGGDSVEQDIEEDTGAEDQRPNGHEVQRVHVCNVGSNRSSCIYCRRWYHNAFVNSVNRRISRLLHGSTFKLRTESDVLFESSVDGLNTRIGQARILYGPGRLLPAIVSGLYEQLDADAAMWDARRRQDPMRQKAGLKLRCALQYDCSVVKAAGAMALNGSDIDIAGRHLWLVTKLDRLGRSTRELLDLIERISKAGAAFRSLGDPLWDTSSSQGRLLSALKRRAAGERLASIAQSYAVDVSMISRLR
jgi:hypothetical protein